MYLVDGSIELLLGASRSMVLRMVLEDGLGSFEKPTESREGHLRAFLKVSNVGAESDQRWSLLSIRTA